MAKKASKQRRANWLTEISRRVKMLYFADMISAKDAETISKILTKAAKKL